MNHSVYVAQDHRSRGTEEEALEKRVAHILPGEDGRLLWVLGELLTYKVPSRRTGGAYSLFEVATQPGGGPPPHVQHREDETFWVLEGEYEFLSTEKTLQVGTGSLLYVPKGTLHSHSHVGGGVGRMLAIQTPGGLFELFFEEAGKATDDEAVLPVFKEHPVVGRIAEAASKYGIEIPPPIAHK